MSRRTLSKFIRTHEEVKLEDGSTEIVKRAVTLPPLPDKQTPCNQCGNPMSVTDGQIRHFCSKRCRTLAKHGYRHQLYK